MDTERLVELISNVIMGLVKAGVIEIHQPSGQIRQSRAGLASDSRRIICLEDVRGITSEEFVVSSCDVLTPLARDYLKEHRIQIKNVG